MHGGGTVEGGETGPGVAAFFPPFGVVTYVFRFLSLERSGVGMGCAGLVRGTVGRGGRGAAVRWRLEGCWPWSARVITRHSDWCSSPAEGLGVGSRDGRFAAHAMTICLRLEAYGCLDMAVDTRARLGPSVQPVLSRRNESFSGEGGHPQGYPRSLLFPLLIPCETPSTSSYPDNTAAPKSGSVLDKQLRGLH